MTVLRYELFAAAPFSGLKTKATLFPLPLPFPLADLRRQRQSDGRRYE